MAIKRRSIKLFEHERKLLIELYLRWKIAIDHFESLPDELEAFVDDWNTLSRRTDSSVDVIHYMRTQRKRGLWVKLGSGYLQTVPSEPFKLEECEALVALFHVLVTDKGFGSDVLSYDQQLAETLADEFAKLTGRIVPSHLLVAKITALRKRGFLPRVQDQPKYEDHIGFDDINKADGQ